MLCGSRWQALDPLTFKTSVDREQIDQGTPDLRSFNQFVNDYRIEYAKRLLLEDPDKKVSSIYYEVGFGHEQTFFRAFKSRTGMTPAEWKKQKSTGNM